jgi:predicted TIM-barrel fold metal-dependent hydrolase
VWNSDRPHPRPEGPTPDAKRLVEVFLDWRREEGKRQAILVDNLARLYGFA